MRKHLPRLLDGPELDQLSVLLCLTACFALGAVAGCCFAGFLGEETQTHLFGYLSSYFSALKEGEVLQPSLFSTVWELCQWPLLAFLLGFTALGVAGVPVLFCLRGFLLSYSVAVFVRLFGGAGFLMALAVFGAAGVCVLPALFLLGTDALRSARVLAASLLGEGRRPSPFPLRHFLRAGGCCVLLAAGTAVQTCLAPALMRLAAGLVL